MDPTRTEHRPPLKAGSTPPRYAFRGTVPRRLPWKASHFLPPTIRQCRQCRQCRQPSIGASPTRISGERSLEWLIEPRILTRPAGRGRPEGGWQQARVEVQRPGLVVWRAGIDWSNGLDPLGGTRRPDAARIPAALVGTADPGRVAVGFSVGTPLSLDFNGHQLGAY